MADHEYPFTEQPDGSYLFNNPHNRDVRLCFSGRTNSLAREAILKKGFLHDWLNALAEEYPDQPVRFRNIWANSFNGNGVGRAKDLEDAMRRIKDILGECTVGMTLQQGGGIDRQDGKIVITKQRKRSKKITIGRGPIISSEAYLPLGAFEIASKEVTQPPKTYFLLTTVPRIGVPNKERLCLPGGVAPRDGLPTFEKNASLDVVHALKGVGITNQEVIGQIMSGSVANTGSEQVCIQTVKIPVTEEQWAKVPDALLKVTEARKTSDPRGFVLVEAGQACEEVLNVKTPGKNVQDSILIIAMLAYLNKERLDYMNLADQADKNSRSKQGRIARRLYKNRPEWVRKDYTAVTHAAPAA